LASKKYEMRKVVIGFLLLLVMPLFTIIGLSDAARAEKDALEDEFYNLKPEVMAILNDTNDFLVNCHTEISDQLSFGLANSIYSEARNRNLSGLIDILTTDIDFEGQCEIDAEALRSKGADKLNDFLNHARDWRAFLQAEVRNLKYSDVYPMVDDNHDIAIEIFRVLDNFTNILDDSILASNDYEAIVLDEFSSEVDQVFAYRDTALEIANDKIENRIDEVLADNTKTDSEKITTIMNYIEIAEDVRVDMVGFHNELQGELTNNQLKNFVAGKKAEAINELDEGILYGKKLLIDGIGKNTLEENLGASETDELIEAVYGLYLDPNVYALIDALRDFLIYNMNNNKAVIESILNQHYGTYEFLDLVNNKAATGSKIVVKENDVILLEYTFIVKGDLLGRATTDITDLITLIDHVLGGEQLSGVFVKAADLNDDNNHDITDVIMLIDLILTGSV